MDKISHTTVNDERQPWAEIGIENHGTFGRSNDSIIYLEHYEGKWQLHVWADINQEDPTHVIDLSNAHEDNREN